MHRPIVLFLLAAAIAPSTGAAEGAAPAAVPEFPQTLVPVPDSASDDDVRARIDVDEHGAVQRIVVLASARPALDEAVKTALGAWHFPPARIAGRAAAASVMLRMAVAPLPAVTGEPVLQRAPGALSLAPGEPLPRFDPARADTQTLFLEAAPEDRPTPMPNEIWCSYPQKVHATGQDPEVQMEAVVGRRGEVIAARVSGQAEPRLAEAALDRLLSGEANFVAARHGDEAAVGVAQVPARFFSPPRPAKNFRPPEYPHDLAMAGIGGTVLAVFRVDVDGHAHDLQVYGATHPKFQASVIDSLSNMRFTPAERLGKPVAVRYAIRWTYRFHDDKGLPAWRVPGGAPSERLPEALQYDSPPEVVLATLPVYPYELALQGEEGSASVTVIVAPSGEVWDVSVADATRPEFGMALKADMENWRFKPALKDGKPTWAALRQEHEFRIDSFLKAALDAPTRRLLRELEDGGADIVEANALDAPLVATFQAQPAYPREQLEARTGDAVIVEFFVDRDGHVQLPHAISYQDAALAWAAATAVARWQYEPPHRGGRPVDVRTRVLLRFVPPPLAANSAGGPSAP